MAGVSPATLNAVISAYNSKVEEMDCGDIVEDCPADASFDSFLTKFQTLISGYNSLIGECCLISTPFSFENHSCIYGDEISAAVQSLSEKISSAPSSIGQKGEQVLIAVGNFPAILSVFYTVRALGKTDWSIVEPGWYSDSGLIDPFSGVLQGAPRDPGAGKYPDFTYYLNVWC